MVISLNIPPETFKYSALGPLGSRLVKMICSKVPISPLSFFSFIAISLGSNLLWKPIWMGTSKFSNSFLQLLTFVISRSIGFSHKTWQLASIAAIEGSAWKALGVQTLTASISSIFRTFLPPGAARGRTWERRGHQVDSRHCF